jgi:tetratricopeptide (TPR) repeat protein
VADSGDGQAAESLFSRALELDPSAHKARHLRATLRLWELGDLAGALSDLLELEQRGLEQADATAKRNVEHLIGEALFQLERHRAAIEHFQRALRMGGDPQLTAEQHLRLAECWEALAEPAAMAEQLNAFLALAEQAQASAEDVHWAESALAELHAGGDAAAPRRRG